MSALGLFNYYQTAKNSPSKARWSGLSFQICPGRPSRRTAGL